MRSPINNSSNRTSNIWILDHRQFSLANKYTESAHIESMYTELYSTRIYRYFILISMWCIPSMSMNWIDVKSICSLLIIFLLFVHNISNRIMYLCTDERHAFIFAVDVVFFSIIPIKFTRTIPPCTRREEKQPTQQISKMLLSHHHPNRITAQHMCHKIYFIDKSFGRKKGIHINCVHLFFSHAYGFFALLIVPGEIV